MTTERRTRQGAAIRAVFERSRHPLAPAEVLAEAQDAVEGIGIATVYRNIKALLDEGTLIAVELPGEPARYEPAGRKHHHHFKCRSCARIFDVAGCVKGLRDLVPRRFQLEGHDLLLFGRCDACARTG